MNIDDVGFLSPVLQETATAGTFAEAEVFQPMCFNTPLVGDVGVVMDGKYFPAIIGSPKVSDEVLLVDVPVVDIRNAELCMQLEDVQVLPKMSQLSAMAISKMTDPADTSKQMSVSGALYIISDTPTEDDPDFDLADKSDPAYIKNEGLSFYSPSHAEYDEEKFDPADGVAYTYCVNEECFVPENMIDRLPSATVNYQQAQTATAEAYARYSTASYTLHYPAVYAEQQAAYQAAYDASYNAARAEVTAAEAALQNLQSQRDAAAQAAYDDAAAVYADQMATAQAEETAAAEAYYQAETDANTAAQAAYDAVIANNGTEDEAWTAYNTEYNSHQEAINSAFNLWLAKSEALWMLQEEQWNAAYMAYEAEYYTWQSQIDTAQQAYDDASANFNESDAVAAAQEAGNLPASAYDAEIEAALEYDNNQIPQFKAADYRAYLDAQEAERIARLNYLQAQYAATTPMAPNPALRCPPTDIAFFHPFWTNPDYPIEARGTVWNGKPFNPPERTLFTNDIYSQRPYLFMRVRAYRYGRLLSRVKSLVVLRLPGKIIIEFEKAARRLTVTTPYSNWVSISAEYSGGGHLFTNEKGSAEAEINANDIIHISFSCPEDAYADYQVKKYLQTVSLPFTVIGEDAQLTESFTNKLWVTMPERGQPQSRKVAVLLSEKPDYYITANGTGDGKSPDNPSNWDNLLTPVALLGNTSEAALALRDKVVWLSGDPVTSQNTFKIPYGGLLIRGGFNSDFTAVTGYSHLSKKTEMPGGTTIENFRATAPNIFALNGASAYGVFRNCVLECSDFEGDGETLYLWSGHSITLDHCIINYSGDPAAIYAPYGLITHCTINASGLCSINSNITDSTISVGGITKFSCYYGLGSANSDGICQNFPADNHVHGYLDSLIESVNIGNQYITRKSDLGRAGQYNPSTQYSGESTYYPARDTPSITRSTLNVILNAGANGRTGNSGAAGSSGFDGESLCCSIIGVAVDSAIHISAGVPGNGGDGGNGSTSYAGKGGRGGSCVIVLPAKLRNTVITLEGGGYGEGGSCGTSGRTGLELNPDNPDWVNALIYKQFHNKIDGKDGRFYVRRPFYWSASSFPGDPKDELLPRYQLTDGSIYMSNGSYSWKPIRTSSHVSDLGKTALPVYWSKDGHIGLPGSYSLTTTDGWTVPVKGYFGSDGGAAGCGAPLPGLTSAGSPGEGKAVAGKSGMAGFTAGEFFE